MVRLSREMFIALYLLTYFTSSYLKQDGIQYEETRSIWMPEGYSIDVGFHRGKIQNITYIFFHHAETFMRPYPSGSASFQMKCIIYYIQWSISLSNE